MAMLIRPIPNFDQLPVEKAYNILYDEIAPICKENGIKLSIYCSQSLSSVKKYSKEKQRNRLCNVEKVQKIFKLLDEGVVNWVGQSIGLYGLRNILQRDKGEFITNGECIAAMLLKGYIADFALDRGKLDVNCQFYSKIK